MLLITAGTVCLILVSVAFGFVIGRTVGHRDVVRMAEKALATQDSTKMPWEGVTFCAVSSISPNQAFYIDKNGFAYTR